MTNKEMNVRLDNDGGILCLTGLLVGTMVFLYNGVGELQIKQVYALPYLSLVLPCRGTFVLVAHHSACQPEVRRIVY